MPGRESLQALCGCARAHKAGLGKERRRQPFSSAAIVDARIDALREKLLHGTLRFVQYTDCGVV